MDQTKQGFEQGGLSGAVRADDADDLALVKGQGSAVQNVHAGQIAGDQVDRVHQRFAGRLADVDFGARAGVRFKYFGITHQTSSLSLRSRTESSPRSMLALAPK